MSDQRNGSSVNEVHYIDEIWHSFSNVSINEYLKNTLATYNNINLPYTYDNETYFKELLSKLITDLENLNQTVTEENNFLLQAQIPKPQVSQLSIPTTQTTNTAWPFIQGLIIGQLSIVVLLIFFIKFFIFAESGDKDNNPPIPQNTAPFRRKTSVNDTKAENLTTTLTNSLSSFSTILKRGGTEVRTISDGDNNNQDSENSERSVQINKILSKTSYDVNLHKSESLDWFNVLIAQIIEQFREEAVNKNNILTSLNNFFTNSLTSLPSYLDTVKVTELDIGNNFPIFSNCRIENEKQQLEAKIDIDLKDRVALGIETKLLLNYPKKAFASLPISLTVAVVKFHGSLTVSLTRADDFIHPPDDENTNQVKKEIQGKDGNGYFLIFSFSPEYILEFETSSLIGARSKLENIPKIASLIEYQIKVWFVERCVEPRFQFVKLPSIWPRSKNVREEKNESSI